MLLLLIGGGFANAADWPRFRGPNGTGISDAKTVPVEWTEDDYNWVIDLPGSAHGSPVVVDDKLYLMCGDPDNATRIIVCVDVADAELRWLRTFPSKPHHQHRDNNYGSSTAAADAEGVVVTWAGPDQLVLMALDTEGETVWRRDLGPYQAVNGAGTSPIIVDDLVVLMNAQMDPRVMANAGQLPAGYPVTDPEESFLIAVDRASGETRWQTERKTYLAGYATPCVRPTSDGKRELVFVDSAHGLTGVDLQTGKVHWEAAHLPHRTVVSPVLAGDLVIGTHGLTVTGERLVAIRSGVKGEEPEVVYDMTKGTPLVPTPIVKDGLVFLWSDLGIVTCIKAATGEVVWKERVGGSYFGSPVWVDGRLYCVDRRGTVAVIAAGGEYELLANVSLGESSFATPAVADGVMYFRTDTQLMSLGGEDSR